MRRLIPVFLATALLFAGCVGKDDPAPKPAATDDTGSEANLSPNNLTDDPEQSVPRELPLSFHNVSYDGETGTFLCYASPAGTGCQGQFSTTSSQDLPYTGTPLTFAGTVTWEAQSPTGSELQVRVLARENGEVAYNESMPVATGSSPLEFTFDLESFAGQELVVDVSSVTREAVGDTSMSGSMAQSFHLEGMLTYRPVAG